MGIDEIKKLSKDEGRPTRFNWPVYVKSVTDGYLKYCPLAHALQKDGVQNSWDARMDRNGAKGWKVTFELIESTTGNWLTITDEGTFGLTGKILTEDELQNPLPNSERWGPFENVAFTKTQSSGESMLGSRGRGKFVFVGSSKEMMILYDSLRDDGTYRFGLRKIEATESPVFSWDESDGRSKLVEFTDKILKPLVATGTRIIIPNPKDDIIAAIKDGSMLRFLGETWWEIIEKYKARIIVRYKGVEKIADPVPIRFPASDIKGVCRIWNVENKQIPNVKGSNLKCKKMLIVYDEKLEADEILRGVAIQRSGMKVCCLELKNLPAEFRKKITGFITLEHGWDDIIRDREDPEHYSISWREQETRMLKQFIEDEVDKFAREKLGLGVDAREKKAQTQRNAEKRALEAVNKIAKGFGFGPGASNEPTEPPPEPPPGSLNQIRLRPEQLLLPRDTLRVNYGESVKSVATKIVNDTTKTIDVRVEIFLRLHDATTRLYYHDVSIPPKTESANLGNLEITFAKHTHPVTGKYTITYQLTSMMAGETGDLAKGNILDQKSKSIYLEEDPPAGGPFEKCSPMIYPDAIKSKMGEAIAIRKNSYELQYNVIHPEYNSVEDDEDYLTDYLVMLMIRELCRVDLKSPEPKLYESEDLESPDKILKKTNDVIGDCLYKYRTGNDLGN